MRNKKLEKILETENIHLKKLHQIVLDAIEEEKLITRKLYLSDEQAATTVGDRIADKVADFGGSWKFIILFGSFLLIWMGVNVYLLTQPFDPYPFILLNLILSTLAAIQAPVIMMSQNRREEKDRQRAVSDYLINLKSEIEIRNMHQKIDLLIAEQMQTLFDIQKDQMNVMEEIRSAINKFRKGS